MNNSPNDPIKIRLGLCCLNTKLREQGVFCSRKPTLKTVEKSGVASLVERARQNCQDLVKMIEWNYQNKIQVFRMSSELLPHFNNPRLKQTIPETYQTYSLDLFHDELKTAGRLAREYGQRLTFHPGQYNVLATPNQDSFEKTILDLTMHAQILDFMELPRDSIMVIHGGGIYGNRDTTKQTWIDRYLALPEIIRNRLVLENCEKCFSIKDCLDVSEATGIPVVLDNHHFNCYQALHPDEHFEPIEHYIPHTLETWARANIRPKFHISEQAEGCRIGKHSDFISQLPSYYLEIPQLYHIGIDIMVEAKLKEQAIFKLYQIYSDIF